MSVDKMVPEIRFKGFSGEWDEKILGELVQLENGFAFQSKYFKKSPTEVIVLTPGSVNIGGGFQAGKGQYYDTKQEVPTRYVFRPNDIFITMTDLTPTAQALGYPAIIPKDNITYLHNQRLGKLVGYKSDLWFLYNLLRTTKKQKEIVATSSGTTVKHTSPDKFLNRACFFPANEEQTVIGNYFQKLDSLINQHQQKHDKLSNIKKAMLEKMFPKQGETIPEIRFKGFSGEWEEKVLEDICDVRDGTHASPQYQQNGFPLVTSKNVKNGYINYDDVQYISKIDFDDINKRSKVDVNDILMGMIGTIGNIALIRETPDFAIKNVALIKDKNLIDFLYSYYFLQSPITTQQLEDCASGGTQKFISLSNVRRLLTCFPEREEQTAIGNYFQKLDALINQHQQQITKLNNIKQACLSKLFV